MKLTRALLAALTLAVLLGLVPSAAGSTSQVDCGPGDGRERLTTEGFSLTFDAPVVTWPGLASPADTRGPFTPWRSAVFPFTADFAPSASATVKFSLDWTNPSDFDILVFDDEGTELGRSDAENIPQQSSSEEFQLEDMAHCQRFTVFVRSWAGSPAEKPKLAITATPSSTLLACVEGDTAPGCAGKAAGEAPDPVPDTRTRLYLGGDPGQGSMVWGYNEQTGSVPFRARLVRERPTGGTPNQYTRPVVGFRDQFRNPFVAHWSGDLGAPRMISGADVLLWASSTTTDNTAKLYVDLYVDGALAGQTVVPGNKITADPTPLAVSIPATEPVEGSVITLQVATQPAVATSGAGNARDAHVSLFYGSVQFPSRITLA